MQALCQASDCGWVDYLQGMGWQPAPPLGAVAQAVESDLSYATGGNGDWFRQYSTYYYDGDAAQSGAIGDSQESWMEATAYVRTQETLSFYWKVSSESNYDWLEFYIDGVRQDRISGRNSGDVYEQAAVKPVLSLSKGRSRGLFRGNSTHLFGVTRFTI